MSEKQIKEIVRSNVSAFASAFREKHLSELEDPDGVINSKVHNVFVSSLGDEVRFYSALSRSLDSSLGNAIEKMAIEIAGISFEVSRHIEGVLYESQTKAIGLLLENYKNSRNPLKPAASHAKDIANAGREGPDSKRHESDYLLRDLKTGKYYIIELKLGGDLDNKKARSEKESLLEQYCLLTNELGNQDDVKIYFATGYNRYGEGKPWQQGRVRQFFAEEELLISGDFWNFVSKRSDGHSIVLAEYERHAHLITDSIHQVRNAYLSQS